MQPFKIFEWNYFKLMQIDCPGWLPGAITENKINTKMMISHEPLVENPTLCKNVSCVKRF